MDGRLPVVKFCRDALSEELSCKSSSFRVAIDKQGDREVRLNRREQENQAGLILTLKRDTEHRKLLWNHSGKGDCEAEHCNAEEIPSLEPNHLVGGKWRHRSTVRVARFGHNVAQNLAPGPREFSCMRTATGYEAARPVDAGAHGEARSTRQSVR